MGWLGNRPGIFIGILGAAATLLARGDASRAIWKPDVETPTESASGINEGEIVHHRPSIGPAGSAVKSVSLRRRIGLESGRRSAWDTAKWTPKGALQQLPAFRDGPHDKTVVPLFLGLGDQGDDGRWLDDKGAFRASLHPSPVLEEEAESRVSGVELHALADDLDQAAGLDLLAVS